MSQDPQIVNIIGINPLPYAKEDLGKAVLHQKVENPEVKIVYFGTPEFSAYVLERLIEFCQKGGELLKMDPGNSEEIRQRCIIQAVITRADKPKGRGHTMTASPVAMTAQKYLIPVLKPAKLDEEFVKNHLHLLTADLFVVVSYGKIIPQKILDIPTMGTINLHGSILPKYRGPSPIQAAILNGEKISGVTIMLVDAEMDHGPILATKRIRLSENENYQTLSKKMMVEGADLLIKTLVQFAQGKIVPIPQNHALATYTKMVRKEDGYFDIQNPPPSEVLERMIKAYYPWPGVWTKWSFGKAQDKQTKIVKFLPEGLVQMEGKKAVKLEDFLRSYPQFPLKAFEG